MIKIISNAFLDLYNGEALATLATLPADSIDACITSPPYWGLRDYGTATWEGGADECNHLVPSRPRETRPINGDFHGANYVTIAQDTKAYAGTCGRCGASRIDQQMGLEPSPFEYIEKMAAVFEEVRRVLKPQGTCWIVIGDSYAGSGKGGAERGHAGKVQTGNRGSCNGTMIRGYKGDSIKPKDLCGIPWRLAFALQERGWYLRSDIIWAKPNPMPESVTDRCTRSHEYIFMLTKSARYFYDAEAIAEPSRLFDDLKGTSNAGTLNRRDTGIPRTFQNHDLAMSSGRAGDLRNRRDVWTIQGEPFGDAHFATFPTKLVELCIKAGAPPDGVILDPFGGCGTTGEVAVKLGRRAVLIELNPEYCEMIRKNLGLFALAT